MIVYLADKSAHALQLRHPHVGEGFVNLARQGRLGYCEIVTLEILYSARNVEDRTQLLADMHATRWFDVTNATLTRALEVQEDLTRIGAHRLPIPDLIVAACAEQYGATVLHHDRQFATIARVTGQPVLDAFELWPPPL
ncbi:MAG: PIN domain-containing protein [Sporichthyaceae bacterium]